MGRRGRTGRSIHADLGPIKAANLKRAHALVESGKSIGKVVLSGFDEAMGQALDDAVAQVAGAVSLSGQPQRASFPR